MTLRARRFVSAALAQARLSDEAFRARHRALRAWLWRFIQKAQDETDRVRAESKNALRRTAERFEALAIRYSPTAT